MDNWSFVSPNIPFRDLGLWWWTFWFYVVSEFSLTGLSLVSSLTIYLCGTIFPAFLIMNISPTFVWVNLEGNILESTQVTKTAVGFGLSLTLRKCCSIFLCQSVRYLMIPCRIFWIPWEICGGIFNLKTLYHHNWNTSLSYLVTLELIDIIKV